MTKDEALQMCLEYIETNAHERRHVRWAIKVALAQPEQEPVKDENAIRADEREECAKVCEKVAVDYYTRIGREHEPYMRATAEDCARHIRARGQPEERNFCPRCGKRTADPTTIHTCTPPYDNALQRGLAKTKEVAAGSQAFYGFPHGPVSTPNAGGKCVTAGETAPPKEIDPNQWAFDNGLEST